MAAVGAIASARRAACGQRSCGRWNSGEYTALLDSIGFEVIAHAVEDWQTGGGRTVWLTRVRVNRVVRNS